MLKAANRSFLPSYWSALVHAPPFSSDRAQPPPQCPRPTDWEGRPRHRTLWLARVAGETPSTHGLINVNRTHPLVAPSPPARPRSVPQSAFSSFFPHSAEQILSSRPALGAHLSRDVCMLGRREVAEGRDL